jgi:hypothetical protein
MTNDESLELPGLQKTKSYSSSAEDWGRQFVVWLEIEYADLASELPANAEPQDFQKAMMIAVERVFDFDESGATPESIAKLEKESLGRLLPIEADAAWSRENNARRITLIDKKIQQTITPQEAFELARLTQQMRVYCDREEMVPLEGARELHRRLLDMKDLEGTSS